MTCSRNRWADYQGAISRISLEPFTEEEARQYLNRKGITNPQVIDVILRLSGRLPLLVATLAAESPTDPTQIGDPSGTAVERFLQWVDDPKRRQIALDAALPRYLNLDVIAVLHGEESADELFNWLIQMPFVEARPDGWAYHNVARTQMLRHKQIVSPQGWANLHGQLADYYDAAQNGLELDQAKRYQNSQWKQYSLNSSYHRLCQAPQKHLLTVLNDFNSAVMGGVMAPVNHYYFLLHWAETIVQTGKDTESAEVYRLGDQLSKGLREYGAGSSDTMLKILTTLLNASDWKYSRRGYTYYSFGFYNEALQEFNRGCELAPTYGWIFGIRGSTFRRLGNYEAAIKDLDHAIELGEEEWMMQRSEVNLILGNFNEALADLNYALQQVSSGSGSRLYYDRAVAYQALGESDKAKTDFELAIQLAQEKCNSDPQDFRSTFFLARYHLASGNSEKAKHFYRDALSKGSPFPRIQEAISDLKELLIVFPNHQVAQQIQEVLMKRIGSSH